MALFDFLRRNKEPIQNNGVVTRFDVLNDGSHPYLLFGELENAALRTAIEVKARHLSSFSVCFDSMTAKPKLKTILKTAPSKWQTWNHFLSMASTLTDLHGTCFIIPLYNQNNREIIGVWPLSPIGTSIIEVNNEVWIRYHMHDAYLALPFSSVGLITGYQSTRSFYGESASDIGRSLIKISDEQTASELRNMNSDKPRFIAATQGALVNADIQQESDRSTLQSLEDGKPLTLYSQAYQSLQQITPHPYNMKSEDSKLLTEKIYNSVGVPLSIVNGTATQEEQSSFYTSVLNPLRLQIEEALNKVIFTKSEIGNGNRISVQAPKLKYIDQGTLSAIAEAKTAGILTRDELRAAIGYDPLPDGAGEVALIRGEYYQDDVVATTEKNNTPDTDENNTETSD